MNTVIQASLDAIPWSRLLRDIHNRQVLPVIGPGLVTVEQNGGHVPSCDWLAPAFARQLGLGPADDLTLNRAAFAHLARNGKRKDIYEELRELVEKHAHLPVPPGLADLAAVRDLDLFITSTFDGFLGKALSQARPGGNPMPGAGPLFIQTARWTFPLRYRARSRQNAPAQAADRNHGGSLLARARRRRFWPGSDTGRANGCERCPERRGESRRTGKYGQSRHRPRGNRSYRNQSSA